MPYELHLRKEYLSICFFETFTFQQSLNKSTTFTVFSCTFSNFITIVKSFLSHEIIFSNIPYNF